MGCELVHLVELACRGGQGDLEAGDLAEPVFASGLVGPGAQIVGDLNEAGACGGVWSEHRAANTGVLVGARRRVGTAAGAQSELAAFEMAEELFPFIVGRDPVFLGWS